MSLALIGITTSRRPSPTGIPLITTPEAYVQAVSQAGGTPVLIPLGLPEEALRDVLIPLAGVLFSGGGDIDPQFFGAQMHPKVASVDGDRDRVEMTLVHQAVNIGMPFLGICRGIQVINVALGGSLYTHITDQLPGALEHQESSKPRDEFVHAVEIQPESRLMEILGSSPQQVNTIHHQGIRQLAPGLVATAHAPDGLIEACELPDHPFGLAVQWHPEWLTAHAPTRALFTAFIQAARDYKGI
jgi:putative glutamine amidotransferase